MTHFTLTVLLCVAVAAASSDNQTVSPHDFPHGYLFPDYPLAGASHPSQSGDYMRGPPSPERSEHHKRIGQYPLRPIQTDRVAEAIAYCNEYLAA